MFTVSSDKSLIKTQHGLMAGLLYILQIIFRPKNVIKVRDNDTPVFITFDNWTLVDDSIKLYLLDFVFKLGLLL